MMPRRVHTGLLILAGQSFKNIVQAWHDQYSAGKWSFQVLTGAAFTDLQTPLKRPLICHRTITDLEMENNVLGTVIAAVSVVSSGMQQIFCRTMQQKHNLASHELLANTAPAQVPVLPMPFRSPALAGALCIMYGHVGTSRYSRDPKAAALNGCGPLHAGAMSRDAKLPRQVVVSRAYSVTMPCAHGGFSIAACLSEAQWAFSLRVFERTRNFSDMRAIVVSCVRRVFSMIMCAQAWTLLLLGPFLDRYISHNWVFNYDWNVPALTFLALSCACAVGVNVSQFMCLGRFSAVSYQVIPLTIFRMLCSSILTVLANVFRPKRITQI